MILRLLAPLPIVLFEVATVLLRAHYTMDVYTGLVTTLLAAVLADSWTRTSAA